MTSVAGLGEGGELGRRDGVDEQEGEARDAAAAGVLESEVGAALGVDHEDGVAEVRAGANLVGEDEIVTSDVGVEHQPAQRSAVGEHGDAPRWSGGRRVLRHRQSGGGEAERA